MMFASSFSCFFSFVLLISSFVHPTLSQPNAARKTCIVEPPANGSDSAPAITKAFKDCGKNGRIVFLNETYHVESVMKTTGLSNVDIDLRGTLLWGTNTTYWLTNSLETGYQNQSTAWIISGDSINFHGSGIGTFNGSGEVWYTCCGSTSNYPGRPHALTIANTTNSHFSGLRFIQSQMWTMTIIHSSNILLQDIYIYNLRNNGATTRNTDGANTIFSDNIRFDGWEVTNGDDSIAIKANSTNILVENSVFNKGLGFAFGSIGQYKGVFERIENVTVRNVRCNGTLHGAYVKTWTGQQVGYPPNGGGGGLGYMKNLHLTHLTLQSVRGTPLSITQCTTFSGISGDCNTSLFSISNLIARNWTGTQLANPIASYQCSAAQPCRNFTMEGLDLRIAKNGSAAWGWNCNNLIGMKEFVCTGRTCSTGTATGVC